MKTLPKSKEANINSFTGDISHIRFWAVQLCQGRCFKKPLSLAQRRPATLTRARGSTGQGLGTDSQLPGCIWSVCKKEKLIHFIFVCQYQEDECNTHTSGKDLLIKYFLLKRWARRQDMRNKSHESLHNDITWAAEQVLRSADAFSSTWERIEL